MANYNISYRIGVDATNASRSLQNLKALLDDVNRAFNGLGGGRRGLASQTANNRNFYRASEAMIKRLAAIRERGDNRAYQIRLSELKNLGNLQMGQEKTLQQQSQQNFRVKLASIIKTGDLQLRKISANAATEQTKIRANAKLEAVAIAENGRNARYEDRKRWLEANAAMRREKAAEMAGIREVAALRRRERQLAAAEAARERRLDRSYSHTGHRLHSAGEGMSQAGHRSTQFIEGTFDKAKEYQRERLPLNLVGLDRLHGAGTMAKTEQYIQQMNDQFKLGVIGTTKMVTDLHAATGDIHHTKDIFAEVAKMEISLKNILGDKFTDAQAFAAGKVLEDTGAIKDHGMSKRWIDAMTFTAIHSRGRYQPQQVYDTVKYMKAQNQTITPEAFVSQFPILESLGPSGMGTAMTTQFRSLAQGIMTSTSAAKLVGAGLYGKDARAKFQAYDKKVTDPTLRVYSDKGVLRPRNMINAASEMGMTDDFVRSAASNPFKMATEFLIPAMEKINPNLAKKKMADGGYDPMEVTKTMAALGLNANAMNMTMQQITKLPLMLKTMAIAGIDPSTMRMIPGVNTAMNASGVYNKMQGTDLEKIRQAETAYEDFRVQFGTSVLPEITAAMKYMGDMLRDYNAWAKTNPLGDMIPKLALLATALLVVGGPIVKLAGNIATLVLAVRQLKVAKEILKTGGRIAAGGLGAGEAVAAGGAAVVARRAAMTSSARAGMFQPGGAMGWWWGGGRKSAIVGGSAMPGSPNHIGQSIARGGAVSGAVANAGQAATYPARMVQSQAIVRNATGVGNLGQNIVKAGMMARGLQAAGAAAAYLAKGISAVYRIFTPLGWLTNVVLLTMQTNFMGYRSFVEGGFWAILRVGNLVWQGLKSGFTMLWDGLKAGASMAADAVSGALTGIYDKLPQGLKDFINDFKGTYRNTVKGAQEWAAGQKAAFDAERGAIPADPRSGGNPGPGHARGGVVTSTGITKVHKGERITPAASSQAITHAGGGGGPLIHIGSLIVREEADIQRIAQKLFEMMKSQGGMAGMGGGDSLVPVYLPGM